MSAIMIIRETWIVYVSSTHTEVIFSHHRTCTSFQVKQQAIAAIFDKEMRQEALQFNLSAMSYDTQRQLEVIEDIGTSAQPNETKVEEVSSDGYGTSSIYFLENEKKWGRRLAI